MPLFSFFTKRNHQARVLTDEELAAKKHLFWALATFSIMAIGCLVRLYLVYKTPYDVSTHDVGYAVGMNSDKLGSGHIGYIEYICKNRGLPDFDPTTRWSFYNPPAFHSAAAIFLRIGLSLGLPEQAAWEFVQYLPFLCITFTVFFAYLLFKEFKIGALPTFLSVSLLSFHPALTHQALALNNDAPALMLTVLAFYLTVRWYRTQALRTLVGVAVCVGLGMMTKLTVALIAPPIAMILIYKFFKEKTYLRHVKHFSLFAVICAPLGLFFPIRNAILYGMPLNYVQSLSETSKQFIGNYSLTERFGLPAFSDFLRTEASFSSASELGFADHNIWSQTLRTSLFDDNLLVPTTSTQEVLASALMIVTLLLALTVIVLAVIGLIRAQTASHVLRSAVSVASLLLLYNFLTFCIDYPFTCTVHFRYITVLLVFAGIGMGLWWQNAKKPIPVRIVKAVTAVLTAVFCLFSAYLCLVCYAV